MEKEKLATLGGVFAAAVGSVCCIGPIVLAGMGLGAGAIGVAQGFGILHWPLMILAFILVGTAFSLFYRKRALAVNNKEYCEAGTGKTFRNPAWLWTALVLTVSLFLFPYIL